jgi:phage shock protein A
MDRKEVDNMVQQLAKGFDALREQYEKLHSQHELLERKLANAREQVNTSLVPTLVTSIAFLHEDKIQL